MIRPGNGYTGYQFVEHGDGVCDVAEPACMVGIRRIPQTRGKPFFSLRDIKETPCEKLPPQRLIASIAAACTLLSLAPALAIAVEPEDAATPTVSSQQVASIAESAETLSKTTDGVAQIGDVQYKTLDDAVEQAVEGSTIVLLQDCELTKGFNKTLTFTGGHKITINKQLTSNGEAWMCFGLYGSSRVLTFDGVEVEWNSEVGTAPWLMLSLSGTMNVTNGAKVVFTVDSGSTGSRNAIYMNAGSSINVTNGSTFEIHGYGTAGKEGQGLQLDKTGEAEINVSGKSTFLIDGTNRGYVNSPTITVDDSTFTVQNCTANASNGGKFTATNGSKVTYQNNAGHGLSAGSVTLTGKSTLTADNNGYYGVYTSGGFTVDDTSTLTVTHNSYSGDFAGLKLTGGVTNGHVAAGATVTITDNYCSGLSNNGKVVFEEGVKLTITGNLNDKGTTSYGGGIYNSGASANLTLPSDTVIYNNHAKTAGDDIFNNSTSTIFFPKVGADWKLDGKGIDGKTDDCTDTIDGWYDDSENARWEAHPESYDGTHVEKIDMGEGATKTVTGLAALKAAHGLGTVTVTPADITIYMGGDEGYEGVSNNAGAIMGSNSLPEPGFYFELPDDIDQAFVDAGITSAVNQAADLSEYMRIYTHGYTVDGEPTTLSWKLERYGENNSEAYGKFVYRIVPDPTEEQEPVPVRLQFTDAEGNTSTSDTFNPAAVGALNQHYTMQLYTELVNANQVVFEVDVNGDAEGGKYYNGMELAEGNLNIRYVTGDQEEIVTDVVNDISTTTDRTKAYAEVPESAMFTINDSSIEVTDSAAPSLLFDDVVTGTNTDGGQDYDEQLKHRALDVATGVDPDTAEYQAKYLDLVDANNGNVWLKSSEPVTVYWPYPAGTDESTEFTLAHFAGLNREMANGAILGEIANATPELIETENTPYGVKFTTNGFSPFVLMWDKPSGPGADTKPSGPGADTKPSGSGADTKPAQPAIPQTGASIVIPALAAIILVAAGVLGVIALRRRHNG